MVDEHLGHVRDRVEQLERGVQWRPVSHLLDQGVPVRGRRHLLLHPVGVSRQRGDHDARRGIEAAFADDEVGRQVASIPSFAQRGGFGREGAERGYQGGAFPLGDGHHCSLTAAVLVG